MILNQLEQENLFLIPLDDERNWYRYHQLFAGLLRRQLEQTQPELLPTLHQRASAWYQQAGLLDEAIDHALAGNDMEMAASLVQQNGLEAIRGNREITLSRWLKALPEAVVCQRPWLCVIQAYIHQWFGQRAQVEHCLQMAEKALSDKPLPSPVEETRLTGYIAAVRAHNALVDGHSTQAIEEAQKALANMPEADPWRLLTLIALGGAYWAQGNSGASGKAFAAAAAGGRQLGEPVTAVSAGCYLGMQQTKGGHLHQAFDIYQEALETAVQPNGRQLPVAGFPLIKMGDLLREWNDLDRAGETITRGLELCIQMRQFDVLTDAYVVQTRYLWSRGNLQGMLAALQKGDQVLAGYSVDPWLVTWLDECRLRYWISTGNLAAAAGWAEQSGLSVTGELSYHHDLHHINLARVLLAHGEQHPQGTYLKDAKSLLARLLAAAKSAGWVHERIKILILQALAHKASGQQEEAVAILTQALTLAEPGGYVGLFIDEGEPLRQLLQQVAMQGVKIDYASKLLAQTATQAQVEMAETAVSPPSLLEPLSQRELEVLRLLNTHLSSTEIAQELFIAPSTVRSHIKNIYSKLNVHRRGDAVQRAQELNLL